ncbi:hypothetical protein NDU88_000389 [Pleurodeles waltl]|uniref:Endonuclease/exonuclease/phosphatase domain-containing protein n=1 Tax=Pleurodeles waltl TaxID=8319 RepID=A0AAV7V4Y9_PLEWA|nr:hypothetical protein NDU88_000389 [Pleurodeles waltl]
MAGAVHPRRRRARGSPEASPSAPVRAWTAPSATPPCPHDPCTTRRRYSANQLITLNPGRSTTCFQSSPKNTKGPFSCHACNFTCDRTRKPATTATNHLHCILFNTRKHAIELWDLLDTTAPDVAFLTETWWNDSSAPDIAIAIPDGYKMTRRDRPNGIGGGIAIAHKSTLKIHTHTDDTLKTAEHLHLWIHTDPNTTLRGTLIYRPPGPRAPFCDSIADFTSNHALTSTDYILLGDLNFHLENNNDANTTSLIDNLSNLGLGQLVNTPTHIAGHTFDPIFSASNHVTFNHTTELHWTYHHCIHFTFKKHIEHLRTQLPPHRR